MGTFIFLIKAVMCLLQKLEPLGRNKSFVLLSLERPVPCGVFSPGFDLGSRPGHTRFPGLGLYPTLL